MKPSGDHYTPMGNKAWQREGETRSIVCPHCGNEIVSPDDEDRALPFRKALSQYGVPVTDIDFVVLSPHGNAKLVLEVTRCDRIYSAAHYLPAVDERRNRGTRGNTNDRLTEELARLLGVRAMLVVFELNVCEPDAYVYRRFIDEPASWQRRGAPAWFAAIRKLSLE